MALVAGVAVVLLVVVLLILPKASQVRSKQHDIQMAEQQQQSLRLQLAQLQADQRDAAKNRATLVALDAQVPPTADLPGVIRLLNTAAAQAGVTLATLSPGGAPPSSAGGSAIPTQIIVGGNYFALEQFLIKLESLTRAVNVLTVALAPSTGTGSLQMTLTANVFTTDISAGPGSQPGPTGTGGGPAPPGGAPVPRPYPTSSSPFGPGSPTPSPG